MDELEIRQLMMLGHAENSIFKLNPAKASWFIRQCLYTPWLAANDPGPRGAFGVIGPRGGKLEGLVMLLVSSHWSSDEKYLEEIILYVHPDYRSTGHAVALIEWMKSYVHKTGLPLITGILSQTRTEAKCRLYRRRLTPVGEFFMHTPANHRWQSDIILSSVPLSSAA